MTKQEIIDTAFTTWGKTRFNRTDLTTLAEALDVSKTALYRYFPSKESLIQRMLQEAIEDFRTIAEKVKKFAPESNQREWLVFFLTSFFSHYIHKIEYFYFIILFADLHVPKSELPARRGAQNIGESLAKVLHQGKTEHLSAGLTEVTTDYLITVSIFLLIRASLTDTPLRTLLEEENLENAVRFCLEGIGNDEFLSAAEIEELCGNCIVSRKELPENNRFFTAIAKTVAEYGMREASMDKIARHLNMKKSSLYFHFTNKEKMMNSMFLEEQRTMEEIYKKHARQYSDPRQKIVCHAMLLTSYLIKRPEMITTVGWMRINNLHLKMKKAKSEEFDRGSQYLSETLTSGDFNLHGFLPGETTFLLNLQITRVVIPAIYGETDDSGPETTGTNKKVLHICKLFHGGLQGAIS